MTPKLNIPRSQKDDKWGEEVIKFYKGKGLITGAMRSEMEVLYKLAAGVLDESDYSYVLNPLGEEQRKRPELQGDPAKIRNFDILGPVINSYLGDFVERGTKFQCVDPNYDIEEVRRDYEAQMMLENLKAQFRQSMTEETGVDTELDNSQIPQEEMQRRIEQLPDTSAIEGQKALDYVRYYNEMDRKYRLAYYDYIVVGRPYVYRDAYKDETFFDVINPLDFNYYGSRDTTFIEDCEAAWVEYRWVTSEIIDRLGDILPKDAQDYIEQNYGAGIGEDTTIEFAFSDDLDDSLRTLLQNMGGRINPTNTGYAVTHMTWKARRKLGRLVQYDDLDMEVGYIEVDEDFKPREGEKVIWQDVNEVWEGWCLDDKFYFGIRPLPLQRGSLSDNNAKLPFNGITYGNRTSMPNTPVKIGKQFQEMHNIVKYRLERTLAKNKDKIMPFPLGAINDKKMDMYQTMYYSEYLGWLFYDETDPKVLQGLTQARAMDLSLNTYIKDMYDLSYAIRQELSETLGLPRQKLGDIKASDDVTNTMEAINRGNIISEDMLMSFEEMQERDYQCLINLTKYVWSGGKQARFRNSENDIDTLNIGEDYASTPHTVFVKGTKEERRKLELLRQQVQPFAQNGYGPVAIGEIIGATNYQQLMHKLDRYERELNERESQRAQYPLQAEQMKQEREDQRQQNQLEFDYYKVDADNDTDKLIKAMELQGNALNLILSGDENAQTDAASAIAQAGEELKRINLKREELAVKREESKNKVRIAKENKNRYDVPSKAKK